MVYTLLSSPYKDFFHVVLVTVTLKYVGNVDFCKTLSGDDSNSHCRNGIDFLNYYYSEVHVKISTASLIIHQAQLVTVAAPVTLHLQRQPRHIWSKETTVKYHSCDIIHWDWVFFLFMRKARLSSANIIFRAFVPRAVIRFWWLMRRCTGPFHKVKSSAQIRLDTCKYPMIPLRCGVFHYLMSAVCWGCHVCVSPPCSLCFHL